MRYGIISPRFIYYMGFFVNAAAFTFYSYIGPKLITSGETQFGLLLTVIMTPWFLWFLFSFLGRHIYLIIDKKENTVLFGNLLFKQEASLDQIKFVKKAIWPLQTFKIQIGVRAYYFTAPKASLLTIKSRLGLRH